jgi:hypothetical protein
LKSPGPEVQMADKVEVTWIEPPEDFNRKLDRYWQRALVAIYATAMYVGARMQNEARQNAPWEDRTGNARGGLFFAVDGLGLGTAIGDVNPGDPETFERDKELNEEEGGDATTLVLALGHSMYYGEYLELAHGQKYAIIMPTIEQNLPELKRMLEEIFR